EEEVRIARDRPIKQVHHMLVGRFFRIGRGRANYQRSRLSVESERFVVRSRTSLELRFFFRGQLNAKLIGNSFGELRLNREHICQIAIVSLSPEMGIVARINELSVDTDLAGRALNAPFE